MSLTKYERETVFNMNDSDEDVRVWTAQGPVIRKCRKDNNYTEVRSGFEEGTEWAEFTIEKRLFRFSSKRERVMTDEQRQELADRLRRSRS